MVLSMAYWPNCAKQAETYWKCAIDIFIVLYGHNQT